ncbi:MAG: Omp28-related outer membrane protein, partial [Bacteroidales bacterium]|nr:Omp28-related outer membrane protein [Bacteroidales bacterium]
MKKLLVFFIGICTGILFLQCDKIEEPFKESPEQNVAADTPYFEIRTDFIQKYLLEDFTGHTCLNCPKAHTIMKEMQGAMKDTLICMAVHCGNFAEPGAAPYTADYRTALGNYLASHFSVSGLPKGMISRMQFNGKRVLNYSEWKADMASVPRLQAEIGIQIKDTTAPSHPDTAYIFVKTNWLKGTARPMRLSVVLLEDSIVSAQKQPDLSVIGDYVHNHMLRASL